VTSLSQELGAPKSEHATDSKEMTPIEIAEKIKLVAKNIRESSIKIRETVRIVRQSGAIDELADAIHTAAVASRDTAKEINEAAAELKESGLVKETAAAIEGTTLAARQTIETVKDSAREVKGLLPETYKTLRQASVQLKKKTARSAPAM
jgi:methyl-accepting chemotaxis protein